MTSRIHRVGVVLAVPLILLSVGSAVHETWLQLTTRDPWAALPIVETAPKKPLNPFDQFDSPPPKPGLFDDLILKPYYRADYTVASIALAIAFSLYAAARAVGWVLPGLSGRMANLECEIGRHLERDLS